MVLGKGAVVLGARILGRAGQLRKVSNGNVGSRGSSGFGNSPSISGAGWSPQLRSSPPSSRLPLSGRLLSCCAKVDLPPPREIIVEYQEEPETTDFFIELADGLENANPELMVLGNPDDIQPRDGSFEVMSGQQVLFSKLQAKRLPKVEEILLALQQLPTEALSCEVPKSGKVANA